MDSTRFNQLLQKVKNCKLSFDELYDFYFPKIVLHISRKFSSEIADDIAQECFLKLLKIEVKEKIDFPTSWMYKICDNLALTHVKKFAGCDELTGEECYAFVSKSENNEELYKCIKREDNLNRKILYLHYWEGYSLKEIAEIVNQSYAMVKQRHSRLLKNLKKECNFVTKTSKS